MTNATLFDTGRNLLLDVSARKVGNNVVATLGDRRKRYFDEPVPAVAIPVADAVMHLNGFLERLVALPVGAIDARPGWKDEDVSMVAIGVELGGKIGQWTQFAEHAQGINGAAIEEDQVSGLLCQLVLGSVGTKDLLRELKRLWARAKTTTLSIPDDCSRGLADCGVAARGKLLQNCRLAGSRSACEDYGLHWLSTRFHKYGNNVFPVAFWVCKRWHSEAKQASPPDRQLLPLVHSKYCYRNCETLY
jgi:hypothetical protein